VIEAPKTDAVVWVKNSKVCWVKDLSVILRREQTEGRWRVIMTEERLYSKIEH